MMATDIWAAFLEKEAVAQKEQWVAFDSGGGGAGSHITNSFEIYLAVTVGLPGWQALGEEEGGDGGGGGENDVAHMASVLENTQK